VNEKVRALSIPDLKLISWDSFLDFQELNFYNSQNIQLKNLEILGPKLISRFRKDPTITPNDEEKRTEKG